jgi:hypothetical protein
MMNPFCAFKEWRRRALERASAKGGAHVFWFYMSVGLVWSLLMFGSTLLVDFYYRHARAAEGVPARALIYFVGGLLFGLVMWTIQETPGANRRDDRT